MTRRAAVAALLLTGLAGLAVFPAHSADRKAALLPAPVIKGNPDNGPAVTDALRASLDRHFSLVAADRVESELKTEKIDPAQPQTVGTLSRLRDTLGADYVVYPRVLSVGRGVNSRSVQATILVNVAGSNPKSFVFTRQIGKVFGSGDPDPENAVIDRASARNAAADLLGGFYRKVR